MLLFSLTYDKVSENIHKYATYFINYAYRLTYCFV